METPTGSFQSLQRTTKNNEQWNVININKLVNSESCFVKNEHQNMSLQKTQNNELLDSFTHPKPSSSTLPLVRVHKNPHIDYTCFGSYIAVFAAHVLDLLKSLSCWNRYLRKAVTRSRSPKTKIRGSKALPGPTGRKTDWTSGTDEHVIVSLGYSIVAGWKTYHI